MSDDAPTLDARGRPMPTGRRRWVGLWVLASALSMIVLDGTIVGVALPTLITELDLDFSDAQWVNGIYSVVFAALLLTAGRLGDRLGRRRAMVFGIALFLIGSLLAALSTSGSTLIIARLVQGVGGAFILPTTLSSVNATFRGRDRAVAFGVWGAVISGVAALGPLLGGWLTDSFGWQWIFLVNLPFGAIILVGTYLTVAETRATITAPGLDIDGLLLSAIGFGALVFGLIEGGSLGWWAPEREFEFFGLVWPADAALSPVPIMLAVGVVALVLFVLWERHRAHNGRSAILDVRLFAVPTFTWGNLVAFCVAVGEFGILFVLPLFIVNAMGLSTLSAGLVLAAMGLGAFVSGAQARHLAARFGAPTVVLIGLGIEFVGVVIAVLVVSPDVSSWLLAGVLALYGLGLGLASAQLTGTVLADIPPDQSGQGSATQSTVRQVGSALGTAVIGAILAAGLAHALPAQLDDVDELDAAQSAQIVEVTEQTAGSSIPALREAGDESPLGPAGPEVADALAEGMADAARWALGGASAFLLLGGVFAVRLRAASRRSAGAAAPASE
ncbi:EmrB/QacA subfamily drug resistance transporter [Agromyces terreus]|uniref:EmrB/QacA subfamily drug resistance transporter n=1 Tax=Agromyces terreus TaxID=424795 RepID=A0A9X2H1E9_9MICO|nr:DHA2 family efflux MFS transporter permease subunit [Agromyces terreus]MCP2371218.1 EmrB/QacA subfamily drug resistance transporter [Agromyces terreus]